MGKKSEKAQIRERFWTTLGRYMAPVPSAEGLKVNWINYKTGVPGVYFKLDATHELANHSIVISHKDPDLQELLVDQMLQLKVMMHSALGPEWIWPDDGKSRDYPFAIERTMLEVNVYREDDWPVLIRFFKENMIALDEWWSTAQLAFESFKR